MPTQEEKWVSIFEFAKLMGYSKQKIYMDIRLGKIPAERLRTAEFINKLDSSQVITRKQICVTVEPETINQSEQEEILVPGLPF